MNQFKQIYFPLLFLLLLSFVGCSEENKDSSFTPLDPNLSFNQEQFDVNHKGGEIEIAIQSNLPWRAEAADSWASIEKSNGLGDGVLKVTIAYNRTPLDRETKIEVRVTDAYKKYITIKQFKTLPGETSEYFIKVDGDPEADGSSWSKATTLEVAMEQMIGGDILYLAEGVYTPTKTITGGKPGDSRDVTFEIHSNVSLFGGFPADAVEGAKADPKQYPTVLSGKNGAQSVYHTVAITAPVEAGKKVHLVGLEIKDGVAETNGTGSVTINNSPYYRFYGGGIIVAKSEVEMEDCIVADNHSGYHAGGIYLFDQAKLSMNRCIVENNSNIGDGRNGGGIFNDAATLKLLNSKVIGNTTSGVGAGIYAYPNDKSSVTYTYIYNSTIANNNNNGNGDKPTRAGGGVYVRENSQTVIVNSTLYGNTGGKGGALAAHKATIDLISCTLANNEGLTEGGAWFQSSADAKISFYNSILTGNRAPDGTGEGKGKAVTKASVVGSRLTNIDGGTVAGVVFDPATMLSGLEDVGAFGEACKLLGKNNPAREYGLNESELNQLTSSFILPVDKEFLTTDQAKAPRNSKTMGAVVK